MFNQSEGLDLVKNFVDLKKKRKKKKFFEALQP